MCPRRISPCSPGWPPYARGRSLPPVRRLSDRWSMTGSVMVPHDQLIDQPLTAPRDSSYTDTFEMRAMSHVCLVESGPGSDTHALPTRPCVRMRAQTFFPSCWDGVNLDSPNHKSHVSVSIHPSPYHPLFKFLLLSSLPPFLSCLPLEHAHSQYISTQRCPTPQSANTTAASAHNPTQSP
jgi:hypothetical protein